MPKTVVIADDHETVVMFLSVLMRRMGFTVLPAHNGAEVLQILETNIPDLVVTDRIMPSMDGLTLLKTMKDDPRLADIPVILVSAYFEQDVVDECMKLGGAGFLTKPIKINDLHQLLQSCLIYPSNKRRKNLRCTYDRRVMVEHDGQQQEYYAVSLSEGGIYLHTREPLPVGAMMRIDLEMQAGQSFSAMGTVIYQKNVEDSANRLNPGMAVKFDDLTTQGVVAIKAHITHMLTDDLLKDPQGEVMADRDIPVPSLQGSLANIKQAWKGR